MLVKLEKDDLINLVCGINPSYEAMGNQIVAKCGRFNGSYETWTWYKYELKKLSEDDLYNLYLTIKELK